MRFNSQQPQKPRRITISNCFNRLVLVVGDGQQIQQRLVRPLLDVVCQWLVRYSSAVFITFHRSFKYGFRQLHWQTWPNHDKLRHLMVNNNIFQVPRFTCCLMSSLVLYSSYIRPQASSCNTNFQRILYSTAGVEPSLPLKTYTVLVNSRGLVNLIHEDFLTYKYITDDTFSPCLINSRFECYRHLKNFSSSMLARVRCRSNTWSDRDAGDGLVTLYAIQSTALHDKI